MKKNKIIQIVALSLVSHATLAMQALDDQALSSTTGQDGITIGVTMEKIDFNQISLIDTNGMTAQIREQAYAGKSAYTIAGNQNSPVSMSFIGANATSPTFSLKLDTDAGTPSSGGAFLNIGASFGNHISGIRISPFAVYLAGSNSVSSLTNQNSIFSSSTATKADVTKLMRIGSESNNFEITFHNINRPQVNVQLGSVPQGHLMQFAGAIQAVCGTGTGCPITIVSGDTGISTNFQMKATNTTTGFLLNGMYAGIENSGLVVGQAGESSKMNIALNNLTMGTANTTSSMFNSLQNGAMGNFGAVGASVKNLNIKIGSF